VRRVAVIWRVDEVVESRLEAVESRRRVEVSGRAVFAPYRGAIA
jgi:hypothetical protein